MLSVRFLRRLKYTFVPNKPSWNPATEPKSEFRLTDENVKIIEKLSLIDIKAEEERERLNDAITMATRLHFVDVEGVDPMYMLPTTCTQALRKDIVENIVDSNDIKKCAEKTVDGFYTSSVSNISDT